MKKFLSLLPLILLALFVGAFVLWWSIVLQPVDAKDNGLRAFVIPRGLTAWQVAQKLEKERLVRSALAFKFYTQLTGKAKKIQAGDYRLSPDLSLSQIVQAFSSGPFELWVTIPEGLRREEVVSRLVLGLGLEEQEKQEFIKDFIGLTGEKEGFLFPDTYLFTRTASASAVLAKLETTFRKRVSPEITKAESEGLSERELVILASIVERETGTIDERSVVAGILLKRLRAGWPLQADATVQYLIGSEKCEAGDEDCDWWSPPTAQDKKKKSTYNTYFSRGLPPTPIANPGLLSIQAVANPADSDYWFYLHDKEGKVHYANTIEEHNENIERYLR